MSQKVKGFLATDGKFFETEPECRRHEHTQALRGLCESHAINPENFFEVLREWNEHIKGYFNADAQCKKPEVVATGNVEFDAEPAELPHVDDDHEDPPVGDKDAPGFLEFATRRNI